MGRPTLPQGTEHNNALGAGFHVFPLGGSCFPLCIFVIRHQPTSICGNRLEPRPSYYRITAQAHIHLEILEEWMVITTGGVLPLGRALEFDGIVAVARGQLAALQRKRAQALAASWKEWTRNAATGSAKQARACLKRSAFLKRSEASPAPAATAGCIADIEEQHGIWTRHWDAEPATAAGAQQGQAQVLAAIPPSRPSDQARFAASDIREAAMSFPAATAQGLDGVHPRQIALISDELLSCP